MGLQRKGAPIGIGVTPSHKLHMVTSGAAQMDIYIDHTLGNGTGLSGTDTYRPIWLDCSYVATDIPTTAAPWGGINTGYRFGEGGIASTGKARSIAATGVIEGAGNADNEYTTYFAALRFDMGTGFTQTIGPTGRGWLTDWSVHGPIGIQPDMLDGLTLFYNNHYNGSPADHAAAGIWLVTKKGSGGATTETHQAANTYPIDVGLGIVGISDVGGTPGIGWTKGIQIGGFGSGWMESGSSRIGTGIEINDYFTFGINLTRHASGTGPAIVTGASSGPVILGATAPVFATTRLEIIGTAGSTNPLVYIGSESGGNNYVIRYRNGSGVAEIFMAGSSGQFLTGTAAGEMGIKVITSGKMFHIGGTTKVVTVTQDNKLGFHAVTPIAQAVLATGAGATVDNVITALQNLGLVKQS